MDVDGWNLLVASLALIGTVVAVGYQYRRDQASALPMLLLTTQQSDQPEVLRFVLRGQTFGDGSWRVSSVEVIEPKGLKIGMAGGGETHRRYVLHPPLPVAPGIAAFHAALLPGTILQHLHVRARVSLRSSSGRRTTAYAEGWYG